MTCPRCEQLQRDLVCVYSRAEELQTEVDRLRAEVKRLRGVLADTASGKSETWLPGYQASDNEEASR